MDLLPAIDILDGKAVRLAKGDYARVTVYNDSPVDQAKEFEQKGARWIHVVDLNGARSGSPENIDLVEKIVAQTSLSVEVGVACAPSTRFPVSSMRARPAWCWAPSS